MIDFLENLHVIATFAAAFLVPWFFGILGLLSLVIVLPAVFYGVRAFVHSEFAQVYLW